MKGVGKILVGVFLLSSNIGHPSCGQNIKEKSVANSIKVNVRVIDVDSRPIINTSINVANTVGYDTTYYSDSNGNVNGILLICEEKYGFFIFHSGYFREDIKFETPCAALANNKTLTVILKSNLVLDYFNGETDTTKNKK